MNLFRRKPRAQNWDGDTGVYTYSGPGVPEGFTPPRHPMLPPIPTPGPFPACGMTPSEADDPGLASFNRLSAAIRDQISAMGAPLTAVKFKQLDPGRCPDCESPMNLDRIDISHFGSMGRRLYCRGRLSCPEGCF